MDKKLYWASVTLTVLGTLVAIYMTIYKWTNNNTMCLGSGDCATVNESIYASIAGIPVALIGVGGYLAMLAVLLLEKHSAHKFFHDNGLLLVFGLGAGGFGFTLYLIYVEAVLLSAWCPFCVTSQIAMTLLFIITVIRLVRQPVQ